MLLHNLHWMIFFSIISLATLNPVYRNHGMTEQNKKGYIDTLINHLTFHSSRLKRGTNQVPIPSGADYIGLFGEDEFPVENGLALEANSNLETEVKTKIEVEEKEESDQELIIIISCSVGGAILLILIVVGGVVGFICFRKQKKRNPNNKNIINDKNGNQNLVAAAPIPLQTQAMPVQTQAPK